MKSLNEHHSAVAAEPQLLFLCREMPWPLKGGARVRNYWLLSALARRYKVDLVVTGEAGRPVPAQVASVCRGVYVFGRDRRLKGYITRAVESLSPRKSFFTAGQTPRGLRSCVARLLSRHSYSAVHVAELGMVDALPPGGAPPVIYDAHNCEYALLRRRAEIESYPFRALLRFDAARVRLLEAELVGRAALVTAPSRNDLDDLGRFCPSVPGKSEVVPSGADLRLRDELRGARPEPGCVLITGSMDWRPNRQGLDWFMQEVLPLLRAASGEVGVRVAGRITPSLAASLDRSEGVTAVPHPDSMLGELARASVVAVPVLASSGTRLRILEAWSAGRPVVTTPAGAFGLPARDGHDLLLGSSPQEFADAVLRLLRERELWERLAAQALETVAQYDWAVIAELLLDVHRRYV